jgi:hypothetical protein
MAGTPRRGCVALPHVDDLLFAVALVGLSALAVTELGEGADYALGAGGAGVAITAAPSARAPG